MHNCLSHLNLKLVLGIVLAGVPMGMAVIYCFWQPWDITQVDLAIKLQGPSITHWLGTDVYGRDVLTLLMGSANSALRVALLAVGMGMVGGVFLGAFAALCKGWVDTLIMRMSDFMFAFPAILLAIILTATLGVGAVNATIAIGVANIPVFARLTRNTINSILPKEFVLAARALGRSPLGITRAHIFPGLIPLLLVQSSVQLSLAVLSEATLTYLNLGVQPPEPSWGRMLYEAQTLFFSSPVHAVIPGLALAVTILGLNQFGGGLRDALIKKYHHTGAFI